LAVRQRSADGATGTTAPASGEPQATPELPVIRPFR
jgi:hypothetical protein